MKILLAEDNVVNQRVAVGLLSKRGHQVTVVENGRKAIEAVAGESFDLVLMDLQMPEMGGFEATASIRASEAGSGRHLRIIAMTAHAMRGDRERCLAAGMDGYLSKPIDPAMLFAAIEIPAAPPAEPAPSGRAQASTQTHAPIVDRESALERFGGDEALLADVIRVFIEDCPARLDEIRTAVEARDAEGIRNSAHALKGAAGNLSARGLFEAAAVLERVGAESRLDAAEAARRRVAIEASHVMDVLSRAMHAEASADSSLAPHA